MTYVGIMKRIRDLIFPDAISSPMIKPLSRNNGIKTRICATLAGAMTDESGSPLL